MLRKQYGRPFAGLIDAVLVDEPAEFSFDGAISVDEAEPVWIWISRDLAPDLVDLDGRDASEWSTFVAAHVPELLNRARSRLTEAKAHPDAGRRLRTQVGGDRSWAKLPTILTALRSHALLDKASAFGRAANGIADEAGLALALQSLPLNEPSVGPLVMQAAVGHVAAPSRLVLAAIRISGEGNEAALQQAGFTSLIDAILAHAQNQIAPLVAGGTYADMDLVCRSVDRYHRLVRGLVAYVELNRSGRWHKALAGITKAISDRIEVKLRDVLPDLNRALRKREGTDRVDAEHLLMALNGLYLLAAVRDARDSLAVNAVLEHMWSQTGQALEIHLDRNLDLLRTQPDNDVIRARLDAALKMAEIRFGHDYAETMRRARDVAERRP